MKKYLILAAVDISKPQQLSTSNSTTSNAQNRNITMDSDDSVDTRSYTKNGCMKFILKEIFPKTIEELITAFEYEGRICSQLDPQLLIGKVLEVKGPSGMESCRGILLLQCDQCQIVGMPTAPEEVMDGLFDDEDLLNFSFI